MNIKLLFFVVLCSFQCAMLAMENRQPAPAPQQNVATVQAKPANDAFALFQRRGIVLACLAYPRLSATLPNLPANCLKCIGEYLKEACKMRCVVEGCNFGTFDSDVMAVHRDEHDAAPTPYSRQHVLTMQQMQESWTRYDWNVAIPY